MALSADAKNRLKYALNNETDATEVADAVDANTAALAWTATTEHAAGAIGTAVAPTTTRRTENGVIITDIKIDLTGLGARGTENDIIGLEGELPAYIGRNVVATNGVIFKVEMSCLEVPLTGDADVILCAGSAATEHWDDAVTNRIAICDGTGDWALGETIVNIAPAITANYYYYLTQGATDDADYTAGQFLIRFYGHAPLA